MSTPQFIQQCNEKKGEIAAAKTVNEEIVKRDSIQPVNDGKVKFASKIGKANPDSTGKKEKSLSPEYEKLINESLNYQFRADSIMELADLSRKQYEKAPANEKPALKSKISETEQLADTIQKLADAKVLAAENLTKPKSGQALIPGRKDNPDSIFAKKSINNAVNSKVSEAGKDTTFPNLKENIQQIITQKADNKIVKDTASQLVTKEKIINTVPKDKELYSIFEVIAKPTYVADEKATVNPEVPAGLIYRIQIAVFRNPVNKVYFKGITPVYGFKSNVPDVTIYYAGMFRRSADASKALIKVKSAGFKDAFVVALLDKKIVSAERAGIQENEWGNKPFNSFQAPKAPDTPRDTVPPTLIFRVEVIKSQKPLNNEQLDNIKKLAGNRGLDVIKNDSGQNIYLIGKFLTFESAAEYADLLTRNGQKEARVTAYLGKREIPVETAKQLFEKF